MVAEPERIALTPRIDGKVEAYEWDTFIGSGPTENYFQWEPKRLYAAARMGEGEDMVVSLDLGNNGWLKGAENYEFRVTMANGSPAVHISRLDPSGKEGPRFVDVPEWSRGVRVATSPTESGWFAELSIDDVGLGLLPQHEGTKIGARVDSVPKSEIFEPFLPRAMAQTNLVFDRGSSLPGGFRWKPQIVARTLAPGQTMKARLTFNGVNDLALQRIEIESKGIGSDGASSVNFPFPIFDNKGRAFVDYTTPVPTDAEEGYRFVRAVVTDAQGNSAFLRTSYRIAPTIEIEMMSPKGLKAEEKERKIRLAYYVKSNSTKRVDGEVEIEAPANWQVQSGNEKGFMIYNARSGVRRVFEVTIPARAMGNFPIKLTANVGDRKFETHGWVHIR